jgi:hypothetical protein
MPRDAYLSSASLFGLLGYCAAINITSEKGLGRSFDGEAPFYSSLFLAGIDRIAFDDRIDKQRLHRIPTRRVNLVDSKNSTIAYLSLVEHFDHYMPNGWRENEDYSDVRLFTAFLADLLASSSHDRPLLLTLGMPKIDQLQTRLPGDLFHPISKLMELIVAFDSTVAVPTFRISAEKISVFEEIIQCAQYRNVEESHSELLSKSKPIEKCLQQVKKANNELYWRWRDALRLKTSLLCVIQSIPALLDILVGSASSSVSKPLVDITSESIKKEKGLLIYDSKPLLDEIMRGVMHRVVSQNNPNRNSHSTPAQGGQGTES